MDEEKKGFVVKDRRLFDESGAARQEEAKQAEGKTQEPPQPEPPPSPAADQTATGKDQGPLPEMDFAGFILSLSTTAMYHFGDFPDPETKTASRNLPAAKQTIDLLSILKAKTEGNLDEDEKQLLDGILYELRMRFVTEMNAR
jgi:hypothetical protein